MRAYVNALAATKSQAVNAGSSCGWCMAQANGGSNQPQDPCRAVKTEVAAVRPLHQTRSMLLQDRSFGVGDFCVRGREGKRKQLTQGRDSLPNQRCKLLGSREPGHWAGVPGERAFVYLQRARLFAKQ